MLYEDIKEAMKIAMKERNKEKLGNIRLIKAEIDRDPNKNYSDENVYAILQRLIKITNKAPQPDTALLNVINEFMPWVSKEEVLVFVETIDFSKLKNKMAAMGIVKKHFQGKIVDSKMLQDIIKIK